MVISNNFSIYLILTCFHHFSHEFSHDVHPCSHGQAAGPPHAAAADGRNVTEALEIGIDDCIFVYIYIYIHIADVCPWLIGFVHYNVLISTNNSSDGYGKSLIEGSLEAKLPTIWRDENAGQLGRNTEMEKVRREKMQVREKVGKSRNTVFFQCFVAPEGRKVGSLKRRVRR